jgi:non-specific serine/threonine protein kinase/serine/threonine-protein kinase
MPDAHWEEIQSLYHQALRLSAEERGLFLTNACAGNHDLRLEIESLLRAAEQNSEFVEKVVDHAAAELVANPHGLRPSEGVIEDEARFRLLPGRRIGPYEILKEVAVGGMGAVYRAIRADGQYRQLVALKIVRAELGAEFAATRFRNERQILASLDHPNVAKILDGGTTADGLPYFVMEFIDGLPITTYCDVHKLSVGARLNLFRTVCSAVHSAHQRLVIHRDIKPSNILITAGGVPKLLDFGIAKILDPNLLPEKVMVTQPGLWLMTPEYASPEQLRGDPITTGTDIYSLGLVLYELLTGHRAHRIASRMPHEIARIIFESEPERPSKAIRRTENLVDEGGGQVALTPEAVSSARGATPVKLQRHLAGDLDNIVLKAIRKEPGERYVSVDQLSEDLRRYLDGIPVSARKSTLAYRWRKYVIRHKGGVAAATLVLLSLITGIVLTAREARIARANAARAEKRFNDVRELAGSLIFDVHDSISALPGATAARKLVLERAQQYLDGLVPEAKTDVALLRELAAAYEKLAALEGDFRDSNLGNRTKALEIGRKSIELRKAALALEPQNRDLRREIAEAYSHLVLLTSVADRRGVAQEAVSILEPLAVSNPNDQQVQYALGKAYELIAPTFLTGEANRDRAREFYDKSLRIYERLSEADQKNDRYKVEVSFGHKHLGSLLAEGNHLEEALEHYRRALEMDEAQLAAHPDDLNARYAITFTYSDTGFILGKRGDLDAALASYHKAADIRASMAAADPRDTRARQGLGNNYNNMGDLLRQKGDYSGALESFKKSLSLRQALAQGDPANERLGFSVAETQMEIGKLYVAMATKTQHDLKKQAAYCLQARPWLQSALRVYLQLEARGEIPDTQRGNVLDIKRNLEQCERLVAAQSR